jgi:hypothetical protein
MVPAAVPVVAVRGPARVASVAVVAGASEVGNQPVLGRPSCKSVEDCCMKSYKHTNPTVIRIYVLKLRHHFLPNAGEKEHDNAAQGNRKLTART